MPSSFKRLGRILQVVPLLGRVASPASDQPPGEAACAAEEPLGDRNGAEPHGAHIDAPTHTANDGQPATETFQGHVTEFAGMSDAARSDADLLLSDSPGPEEATSDATPAEAVVEGPKPLVLAVEDLERREKDEVNWKYFDFMGVGWCSDVAAVMEPCAKIGGVIHTRAIRIVQTAASYVKALHNKIEEQTSKDASEKAKDPLPRAIVATGLYLFGVFSAVEGYDGVQLAIPHDISAAKASLLLVINKHGKSDIAPRAMAKVGRLELCSNHKGARNYFQRGADLGDAECLVRLSELNHAGQGILDEQQQAKALLSASRYSTYQYPDGAYQFSMMLDDRRIGKRAFEELGLTPFDRKTEQEEAEQKARYLGSLRMSDKDRSKEEDRKRTEEGIMRALKKPRIGKHVLDESKAALSMQDVGRREGATVKMDVDLQTPGAGPSNHTHQL